MTTRSRISGGGLGLLSLALLLAVSTAAWFTFADPTGPGTQPRPWSGPLNLQWHRWPAWKFGVRQVAYCSVQHPTLLEWQIAFGPVELRRVRLNPAIFRPAPEPMPAPTATFPGPVTGPSASEIDRAADPWAP